MVKTCKEFNFYRTQKLITELNEGCTNEDQRNKVKQCTFTLQDILWNPTAD